MDHVLGDIRQAVRMLRRSPGFTAIAALALALAIGANTAIFSLVNAVLLRPLPVEGLDRLYVIREDLPGIDLFQAPLAPAEVQDLTLRRDVLEAVTGLQSQDMTLTGFGEPVRVSVAATLADFFGVLGVRPHAGRVYGPEHSTVGPREVAVLSHALWQQLSGGDPAFLGTVLQLDGIGYEVIGVMPPDVRYPRTAQVWVPFAYTERWTQPNQRGTLIMTTLARVHHGVTEAQLGSQLGVEVARWNEQYAGEARWAKVLTSASFVEYQAGSLRLILLVLMGAVALVLLIAAANVASLQLVRASARAREIAVRAALGSGRARIARQLLIESLLLAALGGAAGVWIGTLVLDLFIRWEPARQMNLSEIPLDGTVLAFSALAALVAAVAAGTIPALRAARISPQAALREQSRGGSASTAQQRLLRAGIVLQVALALVLVLGSGLLVRTFTRLLSSDPGFAPNNVMTAQLSIPSRAYDSRPKIAAFYDELLAQLRATPGVEDAAFAWGLPFTTDGSSSPFEITDRPAQPGEPARHAEGRYVSDDYFRTLRIPVLAGREFDATDREGAPVVAVIDQTFAEQFFPDQDPVGQRIRHFIGEATIVGVVGRVDHDEIGDAPKAVAYYPFGHANWMTARTAVVRSALPAATITDAIRGAVSNLDPSVPIYDVQRMSGRITQSLGPRRLAMLAFGGFAALALVLASLGIYGVMRYTTTQRTHEIGIRMAIGANGRDVVGMILRQGMILAFIGVTLGVLAALALTRFLEGVLFGVSPNDPVSFAVATILLGGVALVASWVPAHRATRVGPMEALRAE
jgi:predicted permease